MRLSRLFLVLGLALVGMSLAVFGTLTPAQAAPSSVFGPPTESTKVTLADTSIDGPALWTSPTGSMRAIIAWTGTDGSHPSTT
jgi:hypothetical protein